ncbi:IS4 family transposase [Endozoicomonas montiporae]|uniref:IS4 family transposase n=1 Tax=Endozoicomonas montiporae TaxID=1027273 RepID=UPI001C9DC8F0
MGDQRRTKRLVHTAAELSAHTGSSLAESCEGDLSLLVGGYRLIENEAVKPEAIAEAGFQATLHALQDSELILALEDSTTLGYKHSARSKLGDLGGPKDAITKGFWAHSVMLLDAETERTLGLIDQQRWIRDDDQRGQKHQRKQRPYEEKESFKWQQSSENIERRLGEAMAKTISVCDREADIFEYTLYKLKHDQRFIVRATQNRTLIDNDKLLFDAVAETPVLGSYTVIIPQRGGRKERKATLQIKSKSVTIQSLQRPGGRLQPIKVNVVTAQEIKNDAEDKLCWILLTTEPIATFEDCRKVLRFYELRWRIEEFHKAWKTGAGVERQRMQSADNLERMAVILMFVAVRLIQIREALMLPYVRTDDEVWHEETPANQVVSDDEWQVLWLKMESKKLPDKPPSLIWLFQTIAKPGGWCNSKRTGRPGWLAIWKGWAKLQIGVEVWRMARQFWGVEMC